jgi:WD40 repeat protein
MKKEIYLFIFLSVTTSGYGSQKNMPIYLKTGSKSIFDICFTDKGSALAVTDNKSVKLFSTQTGELLKEFTNGHRREILTIDISKDSSMLASGGKDSTVVIWNIKSSEILKSLSFHKAIVTSIQFSPDCRYLVSGDSDGRVMLYDVKLDRVIREFKDQKKDITVVKFSPDGKLIATAGGDRKIFIYEAANMELITVLSGHNDWIRDVSFSSDSKKLISCGDDSKVFQWHLGNMNVIKSTRLSNTLFNWITGVDYNIDNLSYSYCCFDGSVFIDTPFVKYKTRIKGPVNKVLFKPSEGSYLRVAVATMKSGVLIVDAINMKAKNEY